MRVGGDKPKGKGNGKSTKEQIFDDEGVCWEFVG